MKRFIPSRFQSRPADILRLPPEIVLMVLLYLSTPDRICFLLTCKHFFAFEDRKRLAQLIPLEKRVMLCTNRKLERKPTIQLLRRLEDRRWEYCSECWRLHPRSKWGLRSLIISPRSSIRSCMPFAGEVDLCPCLTITFPDKILLTEAINAARKSDPSTSQYDYDKEFNYIGQSYVHRCSILSHPSLRLQITTRLSVVQKTQELILLNNYNFGLREKHERLNRVPFPEEGEDEQWLRTFFDEAGSKVPDHGHGNSPFMHRTAWGLSNTECYHIKFNRIRNLGSGKWQDLNWSRWST